MASPEYSVIIPAYNEAELLPETLRALTAAMAEIPVSGEIIVVDNRSTDATAAIAASFGAIVIGEAEHRISRVRNRGAAAARGRYLIFIDADTTADKALLQQTLAELASGQCCGGGARIGFREPVSRIPRLLMALWNHTAWWHRNAAGCYFFVPRELFLSVGGFCEELYAGEELALSKTLRRYGRGYGKHFTLLPLTVMTSPRKVQAYSLARVIGTFLLLGIFPWRRRRRSACSLWYDCRHR